ncbi:MAG: hypothetical protein DDT26_00037 [Dehalococcoidia bacterium]|nr:hypothetical protein [Chloroflexota bacterium]
MAFINAVLDDEVAYGFEGGPEYLTGEVGLENGLSFRDSAWEYPRHRYSARFDNLSDVARSGIIKVFHAVKGKRHSFKFKDWNDYEAVEEPLAVPASYDATLLAVQLYKTYTFGSAFTIRPIQALVPGRSTVYEKLGLVLVPVLGTFDNELGTFTPAAPWSSAKTYVWGGEFYVWVHFKDDYNAFTINGWRASTADLDLEEDKREIAATNVPDSWEE